jgi:ankyrin repeat protein
VESRPALARLLLALSLAGCAVSGRTEGDSSLHLRPFLYPDAFTLEEIASESGFPEVERHLREDRAEEALRFLDRTHERLEPPEDRKRLFLSAWAHRDLGDLESARSSLRDVLPLVEHDTRTLLSVWHLLRQMGEEPPPAVADEVLGVILEDHSPDGILVITAAFADGTPRLLASTGGGVIGLPSGFKASTRKAVANVIAEAQQHLPVVPEATDLSLPGPNTIRVVLLTRRGVYAREETWQSIATSEIGRVAATSQQLMFNLGTYLGIRPENPDELLVFAALHQDHDELRRAIEAGADVNSKDRDGMPALAVAVSNQWLEGVEALLSHKADVRIVTHAPHKGLKGTPALTFAAANGSGPVLTALLRAGAPVDGRDDAGVTPLMSASFMGHAEIVEMLLANGAQTELQDDSGYTALMYGSNAGHPSVVRALLAAGADPSASDNQGTRPLMFAAQHGRDDVVRLLLEAGVDPAIEGEHGLSAIGFAVQNGHESTLTLLSGEH